MGHCCIGRTFWFFSPMDFHYLFPLYPILLFLPHSTHVGSSKCCDTKSGRREMILCLLIKLAAKGSILHAWVSLAKGKPVAHSVENPTGQIYLSWHSFCAWAIFPHHAEIMKSFLLNLHKKKFLLADNESSTQCGNILLMKSNIPSHSKVSARLLMGTLLPLEYL